MVQRSKFYADYAPIIFLILIFICLVARVVIAWRSPRQRRVLPVVAEDVAALRRARRAADRRAAEAEAARYGGPALADAEARRETLRHAWSTLPLHRRGTDASLDRTR